MTPIDTIKKIMVDMELPYFSVKNNNQLLYRQVKDMKAAQAADELEDFLNGLTYNYVDVTLSKRSPEEKGAGGANKADFTHRVKLAGSAAPVSGTNSAAPGSNVIDLMQQIATLKSELVKTEWEAKFKALEEKFESGSKNPVQDAALMMLSNILGGQPQSIAAPATAINGHEQAEQTTTDAKTRLKTVIKKLQVVDKDYLTTLELITAFAEKKPAQYESFKPLIKSQL